MATTRRLDLYNTYVSSTSLLQYLGSAYDTVTVSVVAVLTQATALNNLLLGTGRSQSLNTWKNLGLTALVASVAVAGVLQQQADKNGLASWVIWSNSLSAGMALVAQADVQP